MCLHTMSKRSRVLALLYKNTINRERAVQGQVQLGPGGAAGVQHLQLPPYGDRAVHLLPIPGQGDQDSPHAHRLPHLCQQRRILRDAGLMLQVD